MRLTLVTGMSGAGKSVALKTLEDCGFEAVDNIPLSLIAALVAGSSQRDLAVGVDIRARGFSAGHLQALISQLCGQSGVALSMLYLDCDDDVLNRRFSETRRRHPLAYDRTALDGIQHERSLLNGVRDLADLVLDTSDMAAGDLRRTLSSHFAADPKQLLTVHVCSFSFKKGVPREADMVFDVRFLKNPHYEDHLRELSGLDAPVGDYIVKDAAFAPFMQHLEALLTPLLPRYRDEGKSYLTIALGCTGGRHRSVFTAQKLAAWLEKSGYNVSIRHRDI